MKRWYWIELIGFDNTVEDLGVSEFLSRVSPEITGVSIFLYSSEFINSYNGLEKEVSFPPEYCSYAAHPFNEERNRQVWTNFELKKLVEILQSRGIEVVFSTFSTFIYRNEKGEVVVGEFGENHMRCREFTTIRGGNFGAVSVIKRMEDDTYYADYFAKQLKWIIDDFNLQGFHLADGLGFPIYTLQWGDYTDDLVERFLIKNPQISLPENLKGNLDSDKQKSFDRYRFIFENYRYEYTLFMAECFGDFYDRLYSVLDSDKVKILLNGCWTRDPFEALFRFGVDNRLLKLGKAYGYVYENMGMSQTIFAPQDCLGVDYSDKFRSDIQYQAYVTIASLKSCTPEADIICLTPTKDTFEQWSFVEDNPNEFAKGVALRNSNFIYNNGKCVKSSFGQMYCLSDGLKKHVWDMVNFREEVSNIESVENVLGVGYIYNDDINRELKDFISTRRLFSHEIRKRIVSAYLPLSYASDMASLEKLISPFVCTHIDNYSVEDVKKLESFSNIPFAVIGYGKRLDRKPDFTVSVQNTTLYCSFYNLGESKEDVVIPFAPTQVDLSADDETRCWWCAKLRFDEVPEEFFEHVSKTLSACNNVATLTGGDCRVMAYDLGCGKKRVYVYNDAHHFEVVEVKVPFKVIKAKSLVRPTNLQSFTESTLKVKIPNRCVEIIECITE